MSSHHFVKEGQEPALFIAEALSFNSIASLLEWAPMVMVIDTALDTVLSWGIKIDIVLSKPENIEIVEAKTLVQMPLLVLTYQPDQDPVIFGLHELAKNQKAVYIILPASDHAFKQLQNFIDKINIVLLDSDMRWVPVASKKFEKWLPAKTNLIVRKDEFQPIEFSGLTQLDHNSFESISDGKVTLKSNDLFWVGETMS